ncbi:MAG: type II toxin-antitoxin system RelE/ParE family toxin [Legionella sp.]|nr:type II toxin-antitoxin system RelE/ParE family toxin [Legionella sp.]
MRIFKHRSFFKWAKSEGIADDSLIKAITEMNDGLIDAELGGGLFKKRVPISGQGKRSGYRTLIAFKEDDKAFFVYGFKKNERDNIDTNEKKVFKQLSKTLLNLDEKTLKKMLTADILSEVNSNEK